MNTYFTPLLDVTGNYLFGLIRLLLHPILLQIQDACSAFMVSIVIGMSICVDIAFFLFGSILIVL